MKKIEIYWLTNLRVTNLHAGLHVLILDEKAISRNTIHNGGTNWKLMSGGIDYKLGFLTGRLRGFKKEEDLLEMVKKG